MELLQGAIEYFRGRAFGPSQERRFAVDGSLTLLLPPPSVFTCAYVISQLMPRLVYHTTSWLEHSQPCGASILRTKRR